MVIQELVEPASGGRGPKAQPWCVVVWVPGEVPRSPKHPPRAVV